MMFSFRPHTATASVYMILAKDYHNAHYLDPALANYTILVFILKTFEKLAIDVFIIMRGVKNEERNMAAFIVEVTEYVGY